MREYDSPQSYLDDNLRILGNPFRDRLTISWVSNGNENIELGITDIQGRKIYSDFWRPGPGMDFFEIPLNAGETEVLFLSVKTDAGTVTRKIMRMGN